MEGSERLLPAGAQLPRIDLEGNVVREPEDPSKHIYVHHAKQATGNFGLVGTESENFAQTVVVNYRNVLIR